MASELDTASDPTTPEDHLLELARARDPDIRRAVAENLAAPKEALAVLLREFPEEVLDNPASSFFDADREGYLGWASRDDCEWLAGQPLPERVLARVASHRDVDVRLAVARNVMVQDSLMTALAKDSSFTVRFALINNANLIEEALELLAHDQDSTIRNAVAKSDRASIEMLRHLAKDREMIVRVNVAANPRTPSDVLDVLAGDKQSSVRVEVASNANTPVKTLQRLLSSSEPYADVRDAAKDTLRILSMGRRARR